LDGLYGEELRKGEAARDRPDDAVPAGEPVAAARGTETMT